MSERFTFTGDRSLITINDNNGGVEWNSFNSTLTNTINDAGYVTVNDQTQYLSALDDTVTTNTSTTDINLENLNLTTLSTTNPKIEIDNHEFLIQQQQQQETTQNLDEQQKDELVENQVVVYTVEGSDELYGIQLAQDEEGNIQKYQFQFRKTEDGQLEAIPETIQILPLDEDEVADEHNGDLIGLNEQEPEPEPEQQQRSLQIYVQNDNREEHILPDRMEELSTDNYNTMLYTEEENQQEKIEDVKPVRIEHINIKQEVQDFINYNNDDNSQNNQQILDESSETVVEQEEAEQEEQQQQEEEYNATLEPETIYTHVLETQDDASQQQITNEIDNFDNLHENHDDTIKHLVLAPEIATGNDDSNVRNGQNESDNDEYQVVEGLHITGDIDDQLSEQQQQQNHEKMASTLAKTNILKHNQKHPEKIEIKKDNRYFLYFVHNEKENVDSGHLNNTELYKTNPRSILKPCYLSSIQKTESTITTNTTTTTTTITSTEYDERLSKRFARNKEAIQARNLYNFINKTTIPLAPVRKDRLPRKQQIKPLDRQDEQIVVQEMMVSSNNSFIESEEQIDTMKKRDIVAITDYVELTDSDSDYNPNHNKSKKKKKTRRYKLRNHITISVSSSSSSDDDDDDDDSVIELDDLSDDDDDDDERLSSDKDVVKKKRGRPPKIDNTNVESPLKKLCLDNNNDDDDDNRKIEIPCPKCSKSFPSQNSLKTHLQHHNLENTINNKAVTRTKFQQQSTHKCGKCNESFKNRILLAQHKCPTIFTCTICKKRFTDILDLSKHKRSHIKQQLCRNTTSVVKVSPKKSQAPKPSPPPPPTRKFKSPKSVINAKCKQCGKVCSSLSILNLHMKSHKEYICASCKSNFPSKLLLDNHIQKDCVKLTKLQRSLSELKIQKAAASTSTANTPVGINNNNNNKKTPGLTLICDECTMKFTNSKLLIKHKIEKHNLQTPDKSLLLSVKQQTAKRLFKPKPTHTGIPAKQSLRNIFADMQTQLNQETKH